MVRTSLPRRPRAVTAPRDTYLATSVAIALAALVILVAILVVVLTH